MKKWELLLKMNKDLFVLIVDIFCDIFEEKKFFNYLIDLEVFVNSVNKWVYYVNI